MPGVLTRRCRLALGRGAGAGRRRSERRARPGTWCRGLLEDRLQVVLDRVGRESGEARLGDLACRADPCATSSVTPPFPFGEPAGVGDQPARVRCRAASSMIVTRGPLLVAGASPEQRSADDHPVAGHRANPGSGDTADPSSSASTRAPSCHHSPRRAATDRTAVGSCERLSPRRSSSSQRSAARLAISIVLSGARTRSPAASSSPVQSAGAHARSAQAPRRGARSSEATKRTSADGEVRPARARGQREGTPGPGRRRSSTASRFVVAELFRRRTRVGGRSGRVHLLRSISLEARRLAGRHRARARRRSSRRARRAARSRRSRNIVSGGRPFSTVSPVGNRVTGSIVIRQIPSNGTARPRTSSRCERTPAR